MIEAKFTHGETRFREREEFDLAGKVWKVQADELASFALHDLALAEPYLPAD